MEWQPIETAPVHKSVLVFMDGCVFQGILNEYNVYHYWEFPFADYHGCGCCSDTKDLPTHWMPLPKAPFVGK